jgi:hypothetical protein
VEFVDITGDGYKDLVIVGTLKHTGEKESDPIRTEPIALIYVFDPKENQFQLRFQCGPTVINGLLIGESKTADGH